MLPGQQLFLPCSGVPSHARSGEGGVSLSKAVPASPVVTSPVSLPATSSRWLPPRLRLSSSLRFGSRRRDALAVRPPPGAGVEGSRWGGLVEHLCGGNLTQGWLVREGITP